MQLTAVFSLPLESKLIEIKMLKCPTLEKKLKCLQAKKKANFPPHKNKGDIYNLPTEII